MSSSEPFIFPSCDRVGKDCAGDDDDQVFAEMTSWTVWKKSSMAFEGTDGFSIYDSEGRLAFRVDNYCRKHKCFAGEILLMDGQGKAVMALRPQILSMHDKWSGFRGGETDDKRTGPRSHVFSMRRRSILQRREQAEVFMGVHHHRPDHNSSSSPSSSSSSYSSSSMASFRTEGCFRRRSCKIINCKGEEVARISRKKVKNKAVTLGDDVFSLLIQPAMDAELVMAFLVIMDRIC